MLGILVHGDNHFIVSGPWPGPEIARALCLHWSVIHIGAATPPKLSQWQIVSKAFRENLEWAAVISGGGDISPAVTRLRGELIARGVAIHHID